MFQQQQQQQGLHGNMQQHESGERMRRKQQQPPPPPPHGAFGAFASASESPAAQLSPSLSEAGPLPPTIESLARAQSFDGSFIGSPALFQLLVQQPQAPATPTALGAADTRRETVWCTLLCVAYLETRFSDEKDVWSMIVEKAMAWVEETLENIAGADNVALLGKELKDEARKCIA
jgi:hypothetical protein